MRQVVLDTETTGLKPEDGHRIIEIGCVELVKRKVSGRTFHCYLNPERLIDAEALSVHGISDHFLSDKPFFRDVADDFLAFVDGAELVIHNAPFDLGFLNHELRWLRRKLPPLEKVCPILDTLVLAKQRHPKQRNNLDALCKRYDVTHHSRDLHGALLDSMILADVYLAMTGGQISFDFGDDGSLGGDGVVVNVKRQGELVPLKIVEAGEADLAVHQAFLDKLGKEAGGVVGW